MKKLQLFFSFFAIAIIVFSCVPNDPNAIYGLNNSNNPNSPGNITGPRIVTKIDSANITKTEYVSSVNGTLQVVKHHNDPDDVVTYGSNQKITTITFNEQMPTKARITLYYDSAGRVTSSLQENYQNNAVHSQVVSTLTYNSSNKIASVVKKTMLNLISNQFSHYTLVDITYNGENVTKIKDSNGFIINGVMDPVDPNNVQTYTLSDFDNKINPMTTLPKEYLIGCGLMGSLGFGQMSYNNFLKTTIQPSPTFPPMVHQSSALNYDTQNYPVSDVQNVIKIYYKALQ